jgi:hypothetical protein
MGRSPETTLALRVADLQSSQCSPVGHGCHCDYIGITTGVPQIAADLWHRPSRQSRANSRRKGLCRRHPAVLYPGAKAAGSGRLTQ